MWMVRAGRGGRFARQFLDRGLVGLGWARIGDPTTARSKAALVERMAVAYPEESAGTRDVWASQILRFMTGIAVGDPVVTYDGQQRIYHLGQITGAPVHDPNPNDDGTSLSRAVTWSGSIGRDALSSGTLLALGSIATLFKIREKAAIELRAAAGGTVLIDRVPETARPDEAVADADPYGELDEIALERIKDRIARLDWGKMQELVAALLRALGYRTTVSPAGADRGKDIFASPDGFGFEQPRIVVEVKHRPGQTMGAPEVRGFLGGRHKDDRGLYVSTGGFTRDAYYEAERAPIPLTLMTLDDLARALIDSYEKLDGEGKRLLPLTRVYWPL